MCLKTVNRNGAVQTARNTGYGINVSCKMTEIQEIFCTSYKNNFDKNVIKESVSVHLVNCKRSR
jgi:hypothetical protein